MSSRQPKIFIVATQIGLVSAIAMAGCADEGSTTGLLQSTATATATGPMQPGEPSDTDAATGDDPGGDATSTTAGADDGDPPAPGTGGEPPIGPFEPAPTGCVTTVDAGLHDFDCDGLVVTVNVPEACTQGPCGVILDIHGASMSAQQQDNNTDLRQRGGQAGFIVVQPTTDGFSWSAGHDARIMTGLFDVMDAFSVDPSRIHVTGFSAGGGATWVILCTYPDVFASAAPAAATGQYFGSAPVCFGTDAPDPQMDILYINGLTDPFESMDYVQMLVDKILADWGLGDPMTVEGDATFDRVRYINGQGTKFELVTHNYETDQTAVLFPLGGHCYPGSTDHAPTEPGQLAGYGCQGDNAFHYGELVLQFFVDNPK